MISVIFIIMCNLCVCVLCNGFTITAQFEVNFIPFENINHYSGSLRRAMATDEKVPC